MKFVGQIKDKYIKVAKLKAKKNVEWFQERWKNCVRKEAWQYIMKLSSEHYLRV